MDIVLNCGLAARMDHMALVTSRAHGALEPVNRMRDARVRSQVSGMSATFIFLMVVLKLPIFALFYIVWWAVHAEPEPVTGDDGGTRAHTADHGHRHGAQVPARYDAGRSSVRRFVSVRRLDLVTAAAHDSHQAGEEQQAAYRHQDHGSSSADRRGNATRRRRSARSGPCGRDGAKLESPA